MPRVAVSVTRVQLWDQKPGEDDRPATMKRVETTHLHTDSTTI